MSAKATFWAWEQSGISASEKLLLLCLADNHNADNGRCDPGPKYISERTGLNVKTIRACLKSLEEKGLISIQKRTGTSSNYTFNFSAEPYPNSGIPKTSPTQKRVHPKTDSTLPKNGAEPYPKLGTKPNKNLIEPNNKYKGIDFENLPVEISEEAAQEFIDHRINLKKKLTQNAFDRAMQKAVKISQDQQVTLSANQVLETAVDRGWQGFELNWLIKEQSNANSQSAYQQGSVTKLSTVERASEQNEAYMRQLQDRIEREG